MILDRRKCLFQLPSKSLPRFSLRRLLRRVAAVAPRREILITVQIHVEDGQLDAVDRQLLPVADIVVDGV